MEGRTYSFSLTCNQLVDSIQVTTNSAPQGGFLSVTPFSGTEVRTSYALVAFAYEDVNMPISYILGFQSSVDGRNEILQQRSQRNVTKNLLPSGAASSDYALTCMVIVFDVLSASTEDIATVTVNPLDASELEEELTTLLNSTEPRDMDQTTSLISVVGDLMNRVDCTGASDEVCASKNRGRCAERDFSCGECLEGYMASAADDSCVLPDDPNMSSFKKCDALCDEHGSCVFRDINTDRHLEDCAIESDSCYAYCGCDDGYNGESCTVTDEANKKKQEVRLALFKSIQSIPTAPGNATADGLKGLVGSLSTLTKKPSEVSTEASAIAATIIDSVLTQALQVESVSSEDLSGVIATLDIVAQASHGSEQAGKVSNMAAKFGALAARDMVAGQPPSVTTSGSFKVSAAVFDTSVSGEIAMEIEEDSSSTVQAVTAETKAKLYGSNSSSFLSNPKKVKIKGLESLSSVENSTSDAKEVTVVMKSNFNTDFNQPLLNFTTSCTGRENISFMMHVYICPGSNHSIEHNCSRGRGTFTSYCPRWGPACVSPTGTGANCRVGSVFEGSISCTCAVAEVTSGAERRVLEENQAVSTTGVVEVVTIATFVTADVADTFKAASSFNSLEDLQAVLIVVTMFAVVWAGGLAIIFGCMFRLRLVQGKNNRVKDHLQQRAETAHVAHSPVKMAEYLSDYVRSVFPIVFMGDTASLRRLIQEVKKHHRYLLILTAPPGEQGDKKRIITGFQLLTIQTMLMFLLAVFFDVAGPGDDGSCQGYTSESACVFRKSDMDDDRSFCQWEYSASADTYECSFAPTTLRWRTIIYIAVIVSLVASFMMWPLDYLFKQLSAPLADEKKVSTANEAARASVRRRMSNFGTLAMNAQRRVSMTVSNTLGLRGRSNAMTAGSVTRTMPDSTTRWVP